MANDPFDPTRSGFRDDDYDRASRFDNDYQFDPELREGPVSGTRVALFAVGIAVILGAVFYGLNNTSVHQATMEPPAQTAQRAPATPQTGANDTTPRLNTQPGTTTGAAPARPATPPSDMSRQPAEGAPK